MLHEGAKHSVRPIRGAWKVLTMMGMVIGRDFLSGYEPRSTSTHNYRIAVGFT